jgi:hypothetical protein
VGAVLVRILALVAGPESKPAHSGPLWHNRRFMQRLDDRMLEY